MSLSIRTNVASLNAQRNLSATQLNLDSSLARLSSGFRITKAGDDAAGLGISTKLESQIRSYNQAVRNANDGLSVVQASEAALNEQANVLTRLRELAMQSGSDGIGNVERGYVDKEASKLVAELQRISQVTEYNGTKLLDGSGATLDFQVGIEATANDVIAIRTINATTAAGGLTGVVPSTLQAAATAFNANIGSGDAAALAAAIAAGSVVTGGDGSNTDPAYHLANASHAAYLVGGSALVTATASGGSGGSAELSAAMAAFAASIQVDLNYDNARIAAAAAPGSSADAATYALATFNGSLVAAGGVAFDPSLLVAAGPAFDAGLAALGGAGASGAGGGLAVAGLSLSSKAGALAALASIDAALATVSSARADLGAAGNRFQSAIANVQAFSESLAAANSRIKDVDVAEETSRLSRSQILLQAGVSVLAQANQMPQMALKLLG